jgi:hypothetical protein
MLVVRSSRFPDVPPDAERVTMCGGWLGTPTSLPRCYLELRSPAKAGALEPCEDPAAVRRWRLKLRAHLQMVIVQNRDRWRKFLEQPTVTLVCYCIRPPCARFVIAEFLSEQGALIDTARAQ